MPGQPQVGPEISVTQLGGIQLNKPRSNIDKGRCDRIFGLYPRYPDSLSRIPGKQLLRVFEDGDEPREVLQVAQAFMGQSYAVIQNGDAVALYTADEIFNRATPFSLTPTPAPSIGNYALLAHLASNGTAGGAIGAANNVYYPGTINTLLTDAGGIIQAVSGNSFTLGVGTYTINATVSFSAGTTTIMCRAGLFSVTDNAFKTYAGSSVEILGTTGRVATPAASGNNGTIFIKGRFEVVLPSEVFTISMAGNGGGTNWATNANSQGIAASLVTSKSEIYKLINITQV